MSLTESTMLPLGTLAPDFTLPDIVTGTNVHLYEKTGHTVFVIMFICNHCPYVIHVNPELISLALAYQDRDVQFFAINSNDSEKYPDDAPDKMKEVAAALGYPFPYLYDESQQVAKAYDAACTPDFYVFNTERKLVYRGRLDSSRPKNEETLSGVDLREALDRALGGEAPLEKQYPSVGCNIKWKV